jgi:hypothetical protein
MRGKASPRQEEDKIITKYIMSRLGFKEEEYLNMDADEVSALCYLYQNEQTIFWERVYELAVKIFGGK